PRVVPFALSRDNDGNYTYIDTQGEKQRIWSGKPGAMKTVEIVNVQHDHEWDHVTFGTKEGNLKADIKKYPEGWSFDLTWEGKPTLFTLARSGSWQIIFEQLGVYP